VDAAFDLNAAWALDERVALRPESFGALAYHFGTRRLTFLKHPLLVRVATALATQPSARAALGAAGVGDGQRAAIERGLGAMAASGMIVRRSDP